MPDITMMSDRRERRWFQAALSAAGALGGLSMIPMLFGVGQPSEEDQERMLRRQLEIQDEFERKRAGQAGGVPGAAMSGQPQDQMLASLIFEEQMMEDMARGSARREGALANINRGNSELMGLLSGYESKIAALQDERYLTPAELVLMLEGRGVR